MFPFGDKPREDRPWIYRQGLGTEVHAAVVNSLLEIHGSGCEISYRHPTEGSGTRHLQSIGIEADTPYGITDYLDLLNQAIERRRSEHK